MLKEIHEPRIYGPGDPDRGNRITTVSVSNGMLRVSLGISDQLTGIRDGYPATSQHTTMTPDEAAEVAIELLCAAKNTRESVHGLSVPDDRPLSERAKVAYQELVKHI